MSASAPPSADRPIEARALLAGALVLGLYSVIALVVGGIYLDETIYPAQIITGAVEYPAGHPHELYYWTAFSLPNYLSAAMWLAVSDALVVSAFRNWVFLFLSLYAVFTVAAVLSGKARWGYVAAALVALESYLRLSGLYPMWVFPGFYSNGHVGLQFAILTSGLLAGRFWRAGGFCLGLLPAIHATMAIVVWPWAGLLWLFGMERRDRSRVLSGALWGVLIGALLGAVIWLLRPTGDAVPPYDVATGGSAFLTHFTTVQHRAAIPFRTLAYLVNPCLFFALGLVFRRRVRGADPAGIVQAWTWIVALGGVTWLIVLGTESVRLLAGDLPALVRTAMPARFSNVTAVLLGGLAVAGIARVSDRLEPAARTLGLATLALLIAGSSALVVAIGSGRVLVARNLLFVVVGVAGGIALASSTTRRDTLEASGMIAVLVGTLLLFWNQSHVAAFAGVAALGTWAALVTVARYADRLAPAAVARSRAASTIALLASAALAGAVAMPGRDRDPLLPDRQRWDAVSDGDRALRSWFDANSDSDDLVLVAYTWWRAEAQAKFGRPVLFEVETPFLVTYQPGLAPVLSRMTADLYDVEFDDPEVLEACGPSVDEWCEIWSERWRARSRAEWRELAGIYGFWIVLSPIGVPLDLDLQERTDAWNLYTID